MSQIARVADRLVAWVAPKAAAQACSHGTYTATEFCYCSANLQHSYWRSHTYYGDPYCNDEAWTTCYIVHKGCFSSPAWCTPAGRARGEAGWSWGTWQSPAVRSSWWCSRSRS